MPYYPPSTGGGGGAPTGPAGGSLAGSYPNPTVAAGAITAAEIAADTITAAQIAAQTITAAEIDPGTITANEIASDTITDLEISASADIAQSKIKDLVGDLGSKLNGAITTNQIGVGTLAGGITGDNKLTWNVGTSTLDVDGKLTLAGAAGSSGQVLTSNGAGSAPTWQAAAGGSTKVARSYWVSTTGNDVTADGGVSKPFATITAAIARGTSEVPAPSGAAGSNYFEVCIAPGNYTEDVTITRINVILRGASSEFGRGQATVIRGQMTINPTTAVSKFNHRIGLQNLMLWGDTADTYTLRITGTQQFGVDIDSCYIYMQNIGNGPTVIADNTNATRSRVNIANTTINCDETAQPCFDLGGTMELQAGDTVQFQATQATGSALKISGSASAQCDTCIFDSVGSAAIDVSGTQAGSFKIALSNCGITSSTSDGVNIGANGLAIILVRCVFTIATLAKNAILLTSPATAVTYVNNNNIASPGTSATKSAGVSSVPYTAV